MKEQKEKLINHLGYIDSPPKEGGEYQWLGGYILTWKDRPPTVGMRDLEEDEIALLVHPEKVTVTKKWINDFIQEGMENCVQWGNPEAVERAIPELKSKGIEVKD